MSSDEHSGRIARWRRAAWAFFALLVTVWAFGVDEAKSVSGWGTASLLVALAYLCVALWRARWPGPPWWLCAIAFLAMAVDDYLLGIHDEVRDAFRNGLESMLGRYGSLLTAAAILIAGAFIFARWFVARLPRRTAWHATIGFAIAILGAGVIDVLGGRIAAWAGRNSEWHRLNVVLEESLELFGVSVIFFALLELHELARQTDTNGDGSHRQTPPLSPDDDTNTPERKPTSRLHSLRGRLSRRGVDGTPLGGA